MSFCPYNFVDFRANSLQQQGSQQQGYQHVDLIEFYPVIYSLWRSGTTGRTCIAVLCFPSVPVPFHEIAMAITSQDNMAIHQSDKQSPFCLVFCLLPKFLCWSVIMSNRQKLRWGAGSYKFEAERQSRQSVQREILMVQYRRYCTMNSLWYRSSMIELEAVHVSTRRSFAL